MLGLNLDDGEVLFFRSRMIDGFELNYHDLRGNFIFRRNMEFFGLSLVSNHCRRENHMPPAGDGKVVVMQRTNRLIRR